MAKPKPPKLPPSDKIEGAHNSRAVYHGLLNWARLASQRGSFYPTNIAEIRRDLQCGYSTIKKHFEEGIPALGLDPISDVIGIGTRNLAPTEAIDGRTYREQIAESIARDCMPGAPLYVAAMEAALNPNSPHQGTALKLLWGYGLGLPAAHLSDGTVEKLAKAMFEQAIEAARQRKAAVIEATEAKENCDDD